MTEALELIWFQHWGGDCRLAGHDPDGIVTYTARGFPGPTHANAHAINRIGEGDLPSVDGYTFTAGRWVDWAAWLDGGPLPPLLPWAEPIEKRTQPPYPAE